VETDVALDVGERATPVHAVVVEDVTDGGAEGRAAPVGRAMFRRAFLAPEPWRRGPGGRLRHGGRSCKSGARAGRAVASRTWVIYDVNNPRPQGTVFRRRAFHDTQITMARAKKAAGRPRRTLVTRLQRHRAEMRRRGFKLVQLWVPDPNAPGFRNAIRRTRQFLERHPDREWDAYAQRILDDAPGWTDR
jgi:hypothetical protein